jgi:glycosyltransferase involved in cell wall biosynthesis
VCYLGIPPARDGTTAAAVPGLPGKSPGEVWFVYAGTFGEAYGLQTVAKAAGVLLARGARCRFVFAGAGPLQPVVERLAAAHPDAVHFLGTLTPPQLREVYRACDAGLCSYAPDTTVAMPVKLYDYLGAGLAVVNSLVGECGELVRSSGCGFNYAAGDAASLLDTLQRCIDQPDVLAAARAASSQAAGSFDADAQHDRFVSFIERVAR